MPDENEKPQSLVTDQEGEYLILSILDSNDQVTEEQIGRIFSWMNTVRADVALVNLFFEGKLSIKLPPGGTDDIPGGLMFVAKKG